jgi:hypothetical protein
VNGDAPDPVAIAPGGAEGTDPAKTADKPRSRGRVAIDLEISRGRSIGWTIFGIACGALLIWQLGTVGQWGGGVLIAMGVFHAVRLVQTMMHPPGTIIVSDREVSLPRGLCRPDPVVARPQDVTAVYFLRRSVPWNHAAPVLVIELGDKAMTFPRDWFSSEADQRHVLHALRDKAGAGIAVDDPPVAV